MKKDRITSVILICLVISSIVLTVKIWFSEELWPDGYNFFLTPQKIISCLPFAGEEPEKADAVAPTHETMLMPDKIVVTKTVTTRSIYSGNETEFIELNEFAKKILKSLFSGETEKTSVSAEEYCNTIKGSSLLVKYPVSIPTRVLGHLCEVGQSEIFSDISAVKEFSAVPAEGKCFLYIRDTQSDEIFCYSIDFDGKSLDDIIGKYTVYGGDFMSAYELGFYKRADMDVEQKLSFDPFVFIDTSKEKSSSSVIRGINPFDETDPSSITLEAINGIISSFGYNPNTIRRYTDSDGTLVLVEDYSTIKLYRTGILEFSTTTQKKGINMQIHSDASDNPQNVLDTIDSLTEILGGVWEALGMGDMPDIRLSSDIPGNYSDYSLSFDYRYNGCPVIFSFGGAEHAIELEIKDNLLVSLKACVRGYNDTAELSENLSTLDALDRFCEEPVISPDAEDLFLGYIDYGTAGKIYAHWNVLEGSGSVLSIRR